MSYTKSFTSVKDLKLRTTNVSISLPPALRDAARQAAFDDNRSLSSLVARLLSQHLQKEGYLEERAPVFRLRSERHSASLLFTAPRKRAFSSAICTHPPAVPKSSGLER